MGTTPFPDKVLTVPEHPVPPPGVDARKLRFDQALLAVALLAAFVFHAPWVIPLLALLEATGSVFGPSSHPSFQLFDTLFTPRLQPGMQKTSPSSIRFELGAATLVLAGASGALAVGLEAFAWLLSLALATSAAVGATLRVSLVSIARHQLGHHSH